MMDKGSVTTKIRAQLGDALGTLFFLALTLAWRFSILML
jgi:hypothetical protein